MEPFDIAKPLIDQFLSKHASKNRKHRTQFRPALDPTLVWGYFRATDLAPLLWPQNQPLPRSLVLGSTRQPEANITDSVAVSCHITIGYPAPYLPNDLFVIVSCTYWNDVSQSMQMEINKGEKPRITRLLHGQIFPPEDNPRRNHDQLSLEGADASSTESFCSALQNLLLD